jgi:hypothetical protein
VQLVDVNPAVGGAIVSSTGETDFFLRKAIWRALRQ